MRVVIDANVAFSGAGWRGPSHLCLVALARRRFLAFGTDETVEELRDLIRTRGFKARHDPHTVAIWYLHRVKLVEPAPLGKQRSRDLKDDPYLACALGAEAKIILTQDRDLLDLGKPFGIEIIPPLELLLRLAGRR